jgi:hypothetical protein
LGEKKIWWIKMGNSLTGNILRTYTICRKMKVCILKINYDLPILHNFFKQKMKVRLAVQLLSESVADGLEYCEKILKLKHLQNCEATVKFIRMLNNIFDILNSRRLKALNSCNFHAIASFVEEAKAYLTTLRFLNEELIIESKRKTGFVGLVICLTSILNLYKDVVEEKKMLLYVPAYKVSQDHLELFFSSIRSASGWNNNPTARQFTAAYKKLLIRAEIRDGGLGNYILMEQIPVLRCSSSHRQEHPVEQINQSCSPQLWWILKLKIFSKQF